MKDDWPALLPAGMHAHTLDSLSDLCLAGSLASERRLTLFARLCLYINELMAAGLRGELWIDGSFTTEKPEPSDIDLAIFMDESALANISMEQEATLENLLDKTVAAERYGLDMYLELRGDFHRAAYWRGVFGFCHDDTTPKGVAVLQLQS